MKLRSWSVRIRRSFSNSTEDIFAIGVKAADGCLSEGMVSTQKRWEYLRFT